jgi:hypothetical protein
MQLKEHRCREPWGDPPKEVSVPVPESAAAMLPRVLAISSCTSRKRDDGCPHSLSLTLASPEEDMKRWPVPVAGPAA